MRVNMPRSGTFFAGLTTLVILLLPVLSGVGLLHFMAVFQHHHYVALLVYGLLALAALLSYRHVRARAGTVELEAGDSPVSAKQDSPIATDGSPPDGK